MFLNSLLITMNLVSVPQIFSGSNIYFCENTTKSLSISRNYSNSLWINYLSREFTIFHEIAINSLFISGNHYKFSLTFANSLWINSLAYEYSMHPLYRWNSLWIYSLLLKFTRHPLYFSRIHHGFTLCYSNSLGIHYIFQFTRHSLYFSIH